MMRKLFFICLLLLSVVFAQEQVLTLDDCISQALEQNPDFRLAKKQVEIAEQNKAASYSDILPTAGIGYSGTKSSQGARIQYYEGVALDTLDKSKSQSNYASLYISQNLYDGGRWWNAIKQADNDFTSTELTKDYTRQLIISNVTNKFYNVLKSQQLLKVYEKSLENSSEQLKKTEEMLKIGQVAKKDLYKAQVREGNDRLNIIRQKAALKNTLAELNQSMGINANTDFVVSEKEYLKPDLTAQEDAIKKAVENNRELKALETDKVSAEIDYKVAKSYWQPTLSASYGYNRGGSEVSNIFSDFDKNWSSSLNLELGWNIFNGFQRKTGIQKSLIAYNMYDDRIMKKKIEIRNQVQMLVENLNTYMEMIDIYDINILSAEEDLRLAQEMYRLNSATLLEVLDAQVAYTSAQADLINVKYDAKIAESQLALLMGTL